MIIEFAKRFASSGFYVFPTYKSRNSSYAKPYGWTGTPVRDEDKQGLAIPASTHALDIDSWAEQLKEKYKAELSGYGITGKGFVIIDIDIKDGKSGVENFERLKEKFNIPATTLMARSKSGGFHLFFKKPKKYAGAHVKSVSSLTINGVRYEGVDIRGDGGYVQGSTGIGDWVEGSYVIVKGEPEVELTEVPEEFCQYLVASHLGSDLDAMITTGNAVKTNDLASTLRRGELPATIPDGSRNESFFIYLSALKAKGLDRVTAKQLAHQLADRCENKDNLWQSVNLEDMLDRIFEKSTENPYDIAIDMVQRGLYQITGHGSKPKYIMPCDNPYITSRCAHDLSSMRELLTKYVRGVTGSDGKTRQVNPIDVAIRRIPDAQKADGIGYKPGAPDVFQMNDDSFGKRFLNMYQRPFIPKTDVGLDMSVYENEFKLLISRIFGAEGSEEFQLGLDFIAWFIQNPNIKCVIAPYLMSQNRGVGKSLLINLITRIYGVSRAGERQARVMRIDEMGKRFFDPTSALINIVDEVQFSVHRNMRTETALFWRTLKNLVTADTLEVEHKGGAIFNAPNTAGLLLAGNKGGHFPMEEMDRRIWVIDNNARILERGTVDRLFDIVKHTGASEGAIERRRLIESIRYGLAHHKIKMSLDTIRAPMNDLKLELLKQTMTDIEEWVFDYFADTNNLISSTPVITRSMFTYMMMVSDQVTSDHWRDEADSLFRELKRKNCFVPIKNANITAQFIGIPIVTRNGDIIVSDRREVLYTTREHGSFDDVKADIAKQALFRNLGTISQWKRGAVSRAKSQIAFDISSYEQENKNHSS